MDKEDPKNAINLESVLRVPREKDPAEKLAYVIFEINRFHFSRPYAAMERDKLEDALYHKFFGTFIEPVVILTDRYHVTPVFSNPTEQKSSDEIRKQLMGDVGERMVEDEITRRINTGINAYIAESEKKVVDDAQNQSKKEEDEFLNRCYRLFNKLLKLF